LKLTVCKRIISIFVLALMLFNFINIAAWKRSSILSSQVLSNYSSAIDWKSLYPTSEETDTGVASSTASSSGTAVSLLTRIKNKAARISAKNSTLESGSTSQLFAFHKLIELNGFLNQLAGRKIVADQDVFLLNNGYWAFHKDAVSAEDTKLTASHISDLKQYCSNAGIRFLYVQPPTKIHESDPEMPAGAENYENQNFDALLARLKESSVPSLDLRERIDAEGLDHYGMFYVTDHHWKVETALWAAGEIADSLNSSYDCGLDVSKLSKDLYNSKTYRNWFLGSAGRRVSLGCASPEDFTILLPKFPTSLHIQVPYAQVNKTGSFADVIYNKKTLETRDYYNVSCYESQLYGNQPLTQIENLQNPNGPKILVLGDSYSLALVPYLSLAAKETDLIDFRRDQGNFSGSIRSYIDQMKPDIVLLAYEPGSCYTLK
jgi:hypothetical protein